MNFSRFREPTARDELCRCANCFTMVHYESTDEWGYCPECAIEPEEDDEKET